MTPEHEEIFRHSEHFAVVTLLAALDEARDGIRWVLNYPLPSHVAIGLKHLLPEFPDVAPDPEYGVG